MTPSSIQNFKPFSFPKDVFRFQALIAIAALSLGFLTASADTVIVADGFTPNDFNRKAGDALDGQVPEHHAGNIRWVVTSGRSATVFSQEGTIVSTTDKTSNEARVAIPVSGKIVTVSARVKVGTADWVAVGFLERAEGDGANWLARDGHGARVWLLLRPDGRWAFFSNGTVGQLLAGSSASYPSILFKAGSAYVIGVSYDPSTGKARPFIKDGDTEAGLFPNDGGWMGIRLPAGASIGAAGFRINGVEETVAGSASVDDFSVTEASDSVRRFTQLPASIREQIAVGTPRTSAEIEDSPFGIHTTIMREGGGADAGFVEKITKLVSSAGFKWVVDYLSAANSAGLTPAQAEEKFSKLPERCLDYAQHLQAAHVNLLLRLDPLPWAPKGRTASFDYEPGSDDMLKAAAFVRLTVRQLKPYVKNWQIWNEPNIGNTTPYVTPENYVKFFAQMAKVIREEQPDAVIYGPGTAMLQCLSDKPYPWIPRVLDAGLLDYVDVFTFHPYRQPAVRENIPEHPSAFYPWKTWSSYESQIADLKALLNAHIGKGRVVRIGSTEDGMADLINGAGEQPISWVVGAKYELRRELLDFQLGVRPRTLFCLYRPIADPFYNEQSSYSIVTGDFQKKPVYYAAQNLNAVLDSSCVRADDVPVTIAGPGGGAVSPNGKLKVQVYRKDHGSFEELLVFYWSAEISGDTHAHYPASMRIDEPGWEAPLMIDLMSMPVRRARTAPVEIIDSKFVDRSDPEALSARFTKHGVEIDHIDVRDYPLLIKWVRLKTRKDSAEK